MRNWEKSFLLKDCKARKNIDKYYVFSGYNEKININADDISMQVLIDRFVQTFRNNYNGNINVTEFFHLIREILCTISTEITYI